jgi:hypothetical protein
MDLPFGVLRELFLFKRCDADEKHFYDYAVLRQLRRDPLCMTELTERQVRSAVNVKGMAPAGPIHCCKGPSTSQILH